MSTAGEVWRCVFDIAPTYLLELFILTSACSGRQSLRSASSGLPHVRTAIKQHRAFSIVGPSAWLPSELRSLPRYLSSSFYKILKTLFSTRPGLGVPLSSYLEVVLYKFHR